MERQNNKTLSGKSNLPYSHAKNARFFFLIGKEDITISKYKIYVYAICKNEEKFAERWMKSMSEADGVYVLDTGSDDDTVRMLRELGAHVEQEVISPWRFDVARNRSLELVPEDADLCVCTDLDEVFHAGWRKSMEAALKPGVKQVRYRYTWNFLPDGREGSVFWIEKAHTRHDFKWVNPVHEILSYIGGDPYMAVEAESVQLDHHADNTKSRGQYLPLLELAVKEDPNNDRNMHYLGREYMFHQMWQECEETLLRHLALPSAIWEDERCASMRFIARAVFNQGRAEEAMRWLFRAIAEAPHLREPWIEASEMAARLNDWRGSLYFAAKALEITQRGRTYINEAESWDSKPYDLAAIAAYYSGAYGEALAFGKKALEYAPDDERLLSNLEFYKAAASSPDGV